MASVEIVMVDINKFIVSLINVTQCIVVVYGNWM